MTAVVSCLGQTRILVGVIIIALGAAALKWLLGIRYIPHSKVGIVEKLWSSKGSLTEGRIVALNGEAGFQTTILRGGMHPWYFPWQYRIHKEPLVTVTEGKIGYLYARDGAPLPPTQTLGRIVESNHFQDAVAFLQNGGQRGRQRAILREGVFAINQALFVVLTEDEVYSGPIKDKAAANKGEAQLAEAQRLAKRDIARAEGESRSKELVGKGEGARIAQTGLSEAAVFLQKIRAYGDPRLFALSLVADQFAKSAQPLVPERLLIMGGAKEGEAKTDFTSVSALGQLLTLLLAEKAGIGLTEKSQDLEELEKFTAQLTKKMAEEKEKALPEGV